jgi:hypothetical protein
VKALGRASEVQLFRHRDEILELTQLHFLKTDKVLKLTIFVLDRTYGSSPIIDQFFRLMVRHIVLVSVELSRDKLAQDGRGVGRCLDEIVRTDMPSNNLGTSRYR